MQIGQVWRCHGTGSAWRLPRRSCENASAMLAVYAEEASGRAVPTNSAQTPIQRFPNVFLRTCSRCIRASATARGATGSGYRRLMDILSVTIFSSFLKERARDGGAYYV